MGLKAGARAFFHEAPPGVLARMALPELAVGAALDGAFDYLHLFAETQAALDAAFPTLAAHLAPGGMLWVSWPKGGRRGTDLTLPQVIRIGYGHGLVESTTLAVDETWSAIKFTHPKPGKVYRNSYGTLPGDRRDA